MALQKCLMQSQTDTEPGEGGGLEESCLMTITHFLNLLGAGLESQGYISCMAGKCVSLGCSDVMHGSMEKTWALQACLSPGIASLIPWRLSLSL